MRHVWWTTLLLLAPLPAQDAAKKPSPAQREYQQVDDEFQAATKAYSAALRKVVETDEYKKAAEARDQDATKKLREAVPAVDRAKFATRMMEGATKYAGKDDAVRFLNWVVINGGNKEKAAEAFAVLRQNHVGSAQLQELVEKSYALDAASGGAEATKTFLQEVIDKNALPLVRAYAMHALATRLSRGRDASDEDKAKAEELLANAEKLAKGTDLEATIQGPRFEKERLQIGMEAPDIVGEDLEGVKFKLSDYRGKVVVIDFWGDW